MYGEYTIGETISPETLYDVYSVVIYQNSVYYLIDNGKDGIIFIPSELFVTEDDRVNDDWSLFFYDICGKTMCALGPRSFVGKYDCISGIMKKDKIMMRGFIEYKEYLSEWGVSPDIV